ncbi:MAG: ABC transporter ATP-binding protein [Candidatus Hydrothermales bacterium]
MNETILVAEELFKSFDSPNGKIEVLRGVDICVNSRDKILIQGPSGSGKTTLLMLLSLLDKPDHGKIFFRGELVSFEDENKLKELRNRKFGFIFQFYNLIRELNALENVMIPLLIRGESKRLAEEKAIEVLELVGLKEKIYSFPSEMSGGEEQRVAIARAIVNKPEIIFADEPTGSLDEKNAHKIMNILFELVEKNNVSLIMVSHNPLWIEYFDLCYNLQEGKLKLIK